MTPANDLDVQIRRQRADRPAGGPDRCRAAETSDGSCARRDCEVAVREAGELALHDARAASSSAGPRAPISRR